MIWWVGPAGCLPFSLGVGPSITTVKPFVQLLVAVAATAAVMAAMFAGGSWLVSSAALGPADSADIAVPVTFTAAPIVAAICAVPVPGGSPAPVVAITEVDGDLAVVVDSGDDREVVDLSAPRVGDLADDAVVAVAGGEVLYGSDGTVLIVAGNVYDASAGPAARYAGRLRHVAGVAAC